MTFGLSFGELDLFRVRHVANHDYRPESTLEHLFVPTRTLGMYGINGITKYCCHPSLSYWHQRALDFSHRRFGHVIRRLTSITSGKSQYSVQWGESMAHKP